MRTTLIAGDGEAQDCIVYLPDGWVRVWEGYVLPGDQYLHGRYDSPERLAGGRIDKPDWRRIGATELLGNGETLYDYNPYQHVSAYAAVIRERLDAGKDVGSPCLRCAIRPRSEECDECGVCDLPPDEPGNNSGNLS